MLKILGIILLLCFLTFGYASGGEVTLQWDPPDMNTDGTPCTDLAGYKVYYGKTSRNYDKWIDVGNVTTYKVTGLGAGCTYYFAATAYDTSRNESTYSNEVSKTIPVPPPKGCAIK
jgi:fibronectin type 3 domain-containing protein